MIFFHDGVDVFAVAHARLTVARLRQDDQVKALVAALQLVELPLHGRIDVRNVQRVRRLEDARLERMRTRPVRLGLKRRQSRRGSSHENQKSAVH